MSGRGGDEGRAAGAAAQRGRHRSPHHSPAHMPDRDEPDTKNLSQLSDIACLMESDPAALLCAVHPNDLPLPKFGSQDPMGSSLPGPSQNYAEMLGSLPVPGSLNIQPLCTDSQPGSSSQMSLLGSQLTQLAVAVSALPAQPPSSVPPLREAAAQRQQQQQQQQQQQAAQAQRTKGIDALHTVAALCAANEPQGSGAGPSMVPVLTLPAKPVQAAPLGQGYVSTQLTLPGAALGMYSGPKSPNKQSTGPHPSIQKVEHKGSRATRRGPMDEMRQLVRILVKLVPNSMDFLSVPEEGGGGNRVSEEQIKDYLRTALGEAPQPSWGLPDGWGGYLSELFTWAAGREVTREQAMKCARRQPGRSWEAVTDEIMRLGVNTFAWGAPLKLANVRSCCSDPGMDVQQISGQLHGTHSKAASALVAAVAIASGDARKRSASSVLAQSEDAGDSGDMGSVEGQPAPSKRSKTSAEIPLVRELSQHSELTCWQVANAAVQHALLKAGTTPSGQLHELHCLQRSLRSLLGSAAVSGDDAAGSNGSAGDAGNGSGSGGRGQYGMAVPGHNMQQVQVQQSKLLQLLSDGRLGMHSLATTTGTTAFQSLSQSMMLGATASLPLASLPLMTAAMAPGISTQTAVPMSCADAAAAKQQGVVKPCAVRPSPEDILQAILQRSQESQGDDAPLKSTEAADPVTSGDSRPKSGSSFKPYSQLQSGLAGNPKAQANGTGPSAAPLPSDANRLPGHSQQHHQQRQGQVDRQEERQQEAKAAAGSGGDGTWPTRQQQRPEDLRSKLYAAIDSVTMAQRSGQPGVSSMGAAAAPTPMQGVV